MNDAHLHLLTNHFPILGNLFCILLFVWAAIRRKKELTLLALGITVLVAASGYVADYTGGPAHRAIKGLSGVDNNAFKQHTQAANLALNILYANGAAALISLILLLRKKKLANAMILLTFALCLVSAFFLYRVGYYGGLIRHPEIAKSSGPIQEGTRVL